MNTSDSNGNTLLHLVAKKALNHSELLKYLAKYEADPTCKNNKGEMAYSLLPEGTPNLRWNLRPFLNRVCDTLTDSPENVSALRNTLNKIPYTSQKTLKQLMASPQNPIALLTQLKTHPEETIEALRNDTWTIEYNKSTAPPLTSTDVQNRIKTLGIENWENIQESWNEEMMNMLAQKIMELPLSSQDQNLLLLELWARPLETFAKLNAPTTAPDTPAVQSAFAALLNNICDTSFWKLTKEESETLHKNINKLSALPLETIRSLMTFPHTSRKILILGLLADPVQITEKLNANAWQNNEVFLKDMSALQDAQGTTLKYWTTKLNTELSLILWPDMRMR